MFCVVCIFIVALSATDPVTDPAVTDPVAGPVADPLSDADAVAETSDLDLPIKDFTSTFAVNYSDVQLLFAKDNIPMMNFCIEAVPLLLFPANFSNISITCTSVAPSITCNCTNISIDYELQAEQSYLDAATASIGSKTGENITIFGETFNVTNTRLTPWCDRIELNVTNLESYLIDGTFVMPECTVRNTSVRVEVEVLPQYAKPNLTFRMSAEHQYKLSHYKDPDEFVEEFRLDSLPREIFVEQNALRTLYHDANGIHWIKNWDFTNATLCGQFGVECSTEQHVIKLNLTCNNLTGTVPEIFLDLQQLVVLDLSNNILSGNIDFVAKLPLLSELVLSHNRFTGTIEPDLFKFTVPLMRFEIENNFIEGSIPGAFGVHRNLRVFRISNNRITGTLPPFLCDHIDLKVVMASHNQISGAFPFGITDCDDLEVLILSHNRLSGAVPTSLGEFRELRILALDHNELEGEVPDLRALWRLQVLWLHSNYLTGRVPSFVAKVNNTKLQELRCGGNFFECAQPSDLYRDTAWISEDSPADISHCVEKVIHVNETTGEITVMTAIP